MVGERNLESHMQDAIIKETTPNSKLRQNKNDSLTINHNTKSYNMVTRTMCRPLFQQQKTKKKRIVLKSIKILNGTTITNKCH